MMKRFTILLLLFPALALSAQSLYNNGMTISIKQNTIFSVGENATNNGTIINNGSFLIAGAWINNGTYDAGIGDFTLNSSEEQIVNHNAQSFERLIIRGGGTKIFQADIVINDELTLSDGIMLATNNARLFIAPAAQITGGSESSYVAGPLYMNISPDLTYPIGTATTYLPVSMSNIDASSADVALGLEALSPNPISVFGEGEAHVIAEDYAWQLSAVNGTFNSANITLSIVDLPFILNMDDALVMQANTLQDEYISLGQSSSSGDNIQGTISGMDDATGSFYTIGYLNTGEDPESAISVINAITPARQDGKHDFLKILNIELFPNNQVFIYNRWGNLVFEAKGYNNDVVFVGESNTGSNQILNEGTYYYTIKADGEVINGFFVLRR